MRAWRRHNVLFFVLVFGLVACGDDGKRPIGATCNESSECTSGLCYAGSCLDPAGDDDGDGLINRVEAAQGSNPFNADTDGDGIPDNEEYDGQVARDTDGDGIPDAAESNIADADFDCVVDELDPRNEISDGASSPRIPELCKTVGACGAGGAVLSVMCRSGLDSAACEYDGVPQYEAVEVSCDAVDNDCDGETDEGCDPLSVGLIGHWPLDGDGQDIGPFGDHGTVHGAIPAADRFGVAGKAMRFSAAHDRIEVAATEHPIGEVTATYALWVKPDRGWAFAHQGYLSFGDVLETNRRSGLVRLAGLGCTSYVGENNDTDGATCAPEGHWSHIAVVKHGREVRFYLDGRLLDTSQTEAGQDLQSTALVMGLSKVRTDGPYEQFHGLLDDVRVWGRALSNEEVASLASDTPAVGTQSRPAQSCLHIKEATGTTIDGLAWVDIDGDQSREPFQVYCDQTTDGGGWALVWVYEFTRFDDFMANDNAITPRPSWPVGAADTPVSTTPPTSPTTLGALDWSLWRELGWSFTIKSDLADHIACEPGRGSLVHGTSGWADCRMVKDVTSVCDGVVPHNVYFGRYGPSLSANSLYYYFDGNLSDNWPTHDPCGLNTPQHVASPARRGGSVWVRPSHRFVEWPRECNEIDGVLRSNGMRRIDPDGPGGNPSFMAECRFDVERGGWTRLAGQAGESFGAESSPREYLYTRGRDFYRSPVTTAAWDPKAFAESTGLWHHERADAGAGLFHCQGGGAGQVGVGCGPGVTSDGGLPRVLPREFDAETGTAMVCQAPPDVFSTGAETCASDVAIWARRHYCMPDAGQLLGDGGFDQLASAVEPWQSPCWQVGEPQGFKQNVTVDMSEAPPGGKTPSLRVDNPEIGNLIYSHMLAQREFSLVAGRSYTLAFWAKAAAPRSMRVFVQPTTYNQSAFHEDIMLTTEWRRFELGFEARQTFWSTTVDFQFAESSTATIWLDDVALTEDGPSPCGPTQDNLFGNGDFSRGRTCWRFGNRYEERLAGMRTEPSGGPDNSPKAVIELSGERGEGWYATAHRSHVPIEQGRRYRLSMTARASSDRAMYVNVSRWDLGVEPWFDTEQPVSTVWRTYTHDFVAKTDSPPDGANFELSFGEAAAGWFEIADVRLEPLELDPCATFGTSAIADPTFSYGLSCWPFEWHWDALDLYATPDADMNSVRAEVSDNASEFDYMARIAQHGRTLRAGHGYLFKWATKAEAGRRGYANFQDWPTVHVNLPIYFTTQWKQHEVAWVQALDTTTAKLEIGFGGPLSTGSTWFSGLELVDLGEAPCARGRPHIVANGDFSKSHVCWELMRPWDEVSFEATTDPTTFGSAAPSIRLDYTVRTQAQGVAFSHRGLTFVEGQTYVLRFNAKASGVASPFINIFDELSGGLGGFFPSIGAEWQAFSYEFTAFGTGDGRGVIELQLNGQTSPVTIWLDDVVIEPAVAP